MNFFSFAAPTNHRARVLPVGAKYLGYWQTLTLAVRCGPME
jgi:hypothetical protein